MVQAAAHDSLVVRVGAAVQRAARVARARAARRVRCGQGTDGLALGAGGTSVPLVPR